MTQLTFLSADSPLTKTYTQTDGGVDGQPYPRSFRFTSHEEDVVDLEAFYEALVRHAARGHCLLKGNLQRTIRDESRAGLMEPASTSWGVLDFDGLDAGGRNIDQILTDIGLPLESYILQYSASAGIKPGLNAHIFFMLKGPHSPEHLKRWLKWRNLTVPFLREQLELTKSGMALRWPLDITVCQLDKLLYIAPPVLNGLADPLAGDARIQLIDRGGDAGAELGNPTMDVDTEQREVVTKLRAAKGLPNHRLVTKYVAKLGTEILPNPDQSSVTGVRAIRDFVYLNLNGGDSWAYFYPRGNPEVLYNFKGEPPYLLSEIAPDYYREAKTRAHTARMEAHLPPEQPEKLTRFVVNERTTGRHFKITFDPDAAALQCDIAPTRKHVEDWCVINHVPLPEALADWDIQYDPTNNVTIDTANRRINTYSPTKYRVEAMKWAVTTNNVDASTPELAITNGAPEFYGKLLRHVVGDDTEAAYRLLNWIASIFQTGRKPKTAWVLHGAYGTGKGRLARVLRELFGDNFTPTTPEAVSEQFNASIERTQILWVDEVTTDSWPAGDKRITPKLRGWITEDELPIRAMRTDARLARSFFGMIIAANEHNPVQVLSGDRRWNVAPRQERMLNSMEWATPGILDDDGWLFEESNLSAFACALATFPVDRHLVSTPMENEAKELVQRVTQSLPDDIVSALKNGDVRYFIDSLPERDTPEDSDLMAFRGALARIMEGGSVALSTRHVMDLFRYLSGWDYQTRKFTKILSKYGLHMGSKRCRVDGNTTPGMYFDFRISEEDRAYYTSLLPERKLTVVRRNENISQD